MKLVRLLACLSLCLVAAQADAQYTRNVIAPGPVTGLELRIEGELRALPGQRLRYLLTAFEVLEHRELRRAERVRVRVVSSHRLDAPLAEVVTDEHGRARVELIAPDDYAGAMRLVFIAQSARHHVQRRFMVDVWGRNAARFELFADAQHVEAGDTVHVFGRILQDRSGVPLAEVPVTLTLQNGRRQPVGAAAVVTTDALGVFHGDVEISGADDSQWRIVAAIAREIGQGGELTLRRRARSSNDLTISARALTRVARPGAPIPIELIARQRDGRPVAGAVVLGLRTAAEAARPDADLPPPRTDASGRALISWMPRAQPGSGAVRRVQAEVRVTAAGVGEAVTTVTAHVARRRWVATVAVEGGALSPGIESRIYVRVTGVDGNPAPAGTAVRLQAPALGDFEADTDTDGVAVLEGRVRDLRSADRCGGSTSLEARITVARGEAVERCLPVDPDATVRVRPERLEVEAGTALRVHLRRSSAVRGAQVVVALSLDEQNRSVPLVEVVVRGDADEAVLTVPVDVAGEVQLRARPLVGRDRREVRGGVARVRVLRGERLRLEVERDPSGVVARIAGGQGASAVWAVALEEAEADALARRLGSVNRHDASDAFLGGSLAARTRPDLAAPAALRGRLIVALPAPAAPTERGILRDPERARDRFVEGRLALLLSAVEDRVAAAIPSALDTVVTRTRAGRRFNRGLLDALELGASVAGEGARGLDGLPLSIDELERMDSAFRYDVVARRITRERLLRGLVALRDFVRTSELDLAWSWRGDPDDWLPALVSHGRTSLNREAELYDGWGQRLAIRPARGGRARFRFLEPLPGYELVSAGPDGRFGTGDDMYDPFARVLPAGSLYARAVGEDRLLARLGGVELGRISAESLQGLLEDSSADDASAATFARLDWNDVPQRAVRVASEAPWLRSESYGGRLTPTVDSVARVELAVPATSTGYRAVVLAVDATGARAVETIALAPPAPVALVADLPTRLGMGELLSVPLSVSALDANVRSAHVRVRSEGRVAASFGGDVAERTVALDSRRAEPIELRLRGTGPGAGAVHVDITDDAGRALLSRVYRTRTISPSILRSRLSGAAVSDSPTELALTTPEDAEAAHVRLVVVGPAGLARDPELAGLRVSDPALIAWSHALSGRPIPEELADATASRGEGTIESSVAAACALVAFGAQAAENGDARARHRSERRRFSGSRLSFADAWIPALLVALAPAAGGSPLGGTNDPVETTTARLRDGLRGYLFTERGEPTRLARAAAALLLTDRDDAVGAALLAAARPALVRGPRGGLVFAADGPSDELDAIAGTAALAIAAQQLGDEELTSELVAGLAPRAWVALRAGGEAAFWMVAATSYGALGMSDSPTVTLTHDGSARALALEGGAAVVRLGRLEPGQRVHVTLESGGSELYLARLEARYPRVERDRRDGPLRLTLRGDAGRRGGTAAFELRVDNRGAERVASPIVDVSLPPNAALSDEARVAIADNPAVVSVDAADARGLVRLRLTPMVPAAAATIALPLRWLASGRTRGLAVGAYPEGRPWQVTSLASRELRIGR